MRKFLTIQSDDFFNVMHKDVCSGFKGDPQAYSACGVSASDFALNLMSSAGLFGKQPRAADIRLGKHPLVLKNLDSIRSKSMGSCAKWEVSPGAPTELVRRADTMVNACRTGINKFVEELENTVRANL